MATAAARRRPGAAAGSGSPPRSAKCKYYFAYGSNLHIKQMRRRCPGSRFIGRARLANHRWQINERGYANVVADDGRWVDGLVYEIGDADESRLDINEGVAKNAYEKRHMPVLLHRAHGALYRRPVSWIVDKGGPAAVCRRARAAAGPAAGPPNATAAATAAAPAARPVAPAPAQHWQQDVLVYISFSHVQDSRPKDEYVSRINLGLCDARALGIEDDYIRNCIRPFIPETAPDASANADASPAETCRPKADARAAAAAAAPPPSSPVRSGEPSPARKGPAPAPRPDQQTPPRAPTRAMRSAAAPDAVPRAPCAPRAPGAPAAAKPPLPPRPARNHQDLVAVIVVEEFVAPWERRSAA